MGQTGFATIDDDANRPRAARGKRLLFIDADAVQLRRLAEVLLTITRELDVRSPLGELPRDGEYDLVAVNYDHLDDRDRARLIEHYSSPGRRTRLLLLSDGRRRTDYAELFGSRAMTNLLAKTSDVDPEELIVTVHKILRGDIFGIEKYFASGVQSIEARISCASERARILRGAESFAQRIGLGDRLSHSLLTVTDELVTNAIFNAPVDDAGARTFAHLPRTEPVALAAGKEAGIKFCFDGRKLGLSVVDSYGSLSEECILDYLAKCFRRGADQVDTKPGGAGLGLYYIFDAVSGLVINLSPGHRTEMIGIIEATLSFKDFARRGKSFNIFVENHRW